MDAAATFDLCVTQQSLAGAVTHGFQLSWLHHCAQEFSSYRLVKYSRVGCLHPLEEWAQNQASPCLATPGCSFQPKAPCQAFSGEANITSADVLPFYTFSCSQGHHPLQPVILPKLQGAACPPSKNQKQILSAGLYKVLNHSKRS